MNTSLKDANKRGLFTKEQLVKKYHGKFIDTYPHHTELMGSDYKWITVYEVRKVSSVIRENCNPPEELEGQYHD